MIEIDLEGTNLAEVRLDNARDPEQLRRMEELVRTGQCHFCREGFERRHAAPIIYETGSWFITANNFPYDGSVHHYLIVVKRHITKVSEMRFLEKNELFNAIEWLELKLKVSGESIFVRSGDMAYTSATLDHLHFHFIVGERKVGTESNKLEDLILAPVGYKKK